MLLKEYINNILDDYTITSIDEKLLRVTLNSNFSDFEDAVQYFCTKNIGADLIISIDGER